MLIYIFAEHYPSPFKPYFDTQFDQFLSDGHELRIFAAARHGRESTAKASRRGLDRRTRYLPQTLRNVPRAVLPAVGVLARQPGRQMAALLAARGAALGAKQQCLYGLRALLLPRQRPDLCLVHNLVTLRHYRFLKQIYPEVPLVLYYHGGEIDGVPEIACDQAERAFAVADRVFTNTENSKAQAIARGCEPAKLVVNPVGFDLSEFRPAPGRVYRPDGLLRLISVGRLSHEKGFAYVLQALRQLQTESGLRWRYRIVGSGREENALRDFVAEQGLSDHVEFMGQLAREPLSRELECSDALILPSIPWGNWEETQACVLQEAMLMKALVVASRTGGVPESISPKMERFSFEPADVAAIADSVRQLAALADSEWRQLGEQGRQFVVENYDINVTNRRLITLCGGAGMRPPATACSPAVKPRPCLHGRGGD